NTAPLWSPDGKKIIFDSNRNKDSHDIFWKLPNSDAAEELLVKTDHADSVATSWSPDGSYLLYMVLNSKTLWDVWGVQVANDRKPTPLMTAEYSEMWARFSPDGKWIAYQSDQTREPQIYVRRFPLTSERWPVSTEGGRLPVWHPNGKELFYLTNEGLVAV